MPKTQTPKETDKIAKKATTSTTPKYNFSTFSEMVRFVRSVKQASDLCGEMKVYIEGLFKKYYPNNDYNYVFLYDPDESISDWTQDRIYATLTPLKKKDLLLFIHSPGGQVEPAYFISMACKEYSLKFVATVPRKAKSAATLIVLGADEIHMSIMSQLGPIDPQINGLPALGLSNAVENIAKLSEKYPKASEMFARYLARKIDPAEFGYFERISESSVQYGQRLLENVGNISPEAAMEIARKLVYEYKDHSFVIDKKEAHKLLGEKIKIDTNEIKLADEIYKFLDNITLLVRIIHKQKLTLIGNVTDGFFFSDIK